MNTQFSLPASSKIRPVRFIRLGASRAAFTLLELIMASGLGLVIILASFSLMSAMRATDERTKDRNAASAELSRAHQVLSRAFGSIVVKATQPRQPTRPQLTIATAATSDSKALADTTNKDQQRPEDLTPPRVLLEQDRASAGQQRLEMTVSEPPIMAGIDGTLLPGERAEWYSKTRGAFELKPAKIGVGLDLYWVVYPLPNEDPLPPPTDSSKTDPLAAAGATGEGIASPPVEPAVDGPMQQSSEPLASLLVARNLERCNFRLVRSGENGFIEPLTEARVTTEEELPAYLELDIATKQGQTATWMFEVGWTVEPRKAPGSRNSADTLRAGGKNGGAAGSGRSSASGRGSFGGRRDTGGVTPSKEGRAKGGDK